MISFKNCDNQYIGSGIDFKPRFKIHKSDIKTKKDRCGTARHYNKKMFWYPKFTQVSSNTINWSRGQWRRSGMNHSMSRVSDFYASKRKGCSKKCYTVYNVMSGCPVQ